MQELRAKGQKTQSNNVHKYQLSCGRYYHSKLKMMEEKLGKRQEAYFVSEENRLIAEKNVSKYINIYYINIMLNLTWTKY